MDWWLILLTIIIGALCLYLFSTRSHDYFKKRGIPYVKPRPIFGNMTQIIFKTKSLPDVIQEVYDCNRDAKYVGFFDFSTPVIMIKDPELVKSITIKNFDSFPNHRFFADSSNEPLFQKNLFALNDDAWREMRSLLSPAFTSSKMKIMFKTMADCAVNFANHLTEINPRPRDFDMKDTFGRYTLDVIASTAFGLTTNSMTDRDNDFYRLGKSVADFSGLKLMKVFLNSNWPWLANILNIKLVDDKTAKYFTDIIESTIATRDAQGIVRPDMINLMMETRNNKEKIVLSSDDITAQAFVFFLGGFDSPATVMSFVAYALAVHTDIQRKLQAEIDEVLENNNGAATYEALHSMKYLDAVVNETMRLFPPGAFLDRVGPKSFTLPPALPGLDPLTLNPGDSVWIPVYSFHKDERYFPQPDIFDPERFNDDNKSGINPNIYMPFGIGPRICIASRFALMEVKLALFHLLAKCDLVKTSKTKYPPKMSTDGIAMMPEGGFWMNIVPRNQS